MVDDAAWPCAVSLAALLFDTVVLQGSHTFRDQSSRFDFRSVLADTDIICTRHIERVASVELDLFSNFDGKLFRTERSDWQLRP